MNNKKNGASKLIIILITIVILAAIIIAISFVLINNNKNKQMSLLNEEINNIVTSKAVNDEIKTKGDFAKVEKALKEYLKEYLEKSNELSNLYNDSILKDSLTASNFASDGPEFAKTKENIQKIRETEKNVKERLNQMVSDEYINSKADELNLNEYYSNIFKDTLNLKEDVSKFNELIEKYDKCVNGIENVLNFLTENKDNWSIKDDKVMFYKANLLSTYNSLVMEVNSAQTDLKLFSTTTLVNSND